MRTTTQLARVFGEPAMAQAGAARVLVVGAGGIGCELLKNLSMSGFRHIHAVDLDTIDLSNLNRQFLFRHKHIKRPKAEVAIQAIREFNPGINATARQANIKESACDVDWFAGFDLVLNALDNLDARRHVNAMCLAARVPLIESGTAGYLGQVTVISGGRTECFECQPKAAERKTYPVCTIRSTPTAPIHCIVWAKDYLFAQLFGEQADAADDDQGMSAEEKADNMEELQQLRDEARALARLADAMGSADFAPRVFAKVFSDDIARLLSMPDMWKQRRPPTRLDYAELHNAASPGFDPAHPDDQAVLPAADSLALFAHTAGRLAQRVLDQRRQGAPGALLFDKDDDDALAFVAATANLRSHAFGIEPQSVFAIKAMAGNIIPAIATTNAIVAGMMVMQAILVLTQRLAECHTAYVVYGGRRTRTIIREPLADPSPQCPVCRRRYLTLRVADCKRSTLGDVLRLVSELAGTANDLGLGDDIAAVEGSRILYDPDFDDNLDRSLADLGLVPGKMVTLASEDDDIAAVPVILSIAKQREQGDLEQPVLVIEGFESLPEFAPLPESTHDDDAPAAIAGEDADIIDDTGVIVLDDDCGDDGNIIALDGSDKDKDNDRDSVGHISDELHKRKLDDVGTLHEDLPKRRALPDAEDSDSDIVLLDE
ncbi:E1 ubiquitin-activating protein uba2 [Coemansia spiralis]|nr:E1 ubiquitin-activating protein uba2 [Coemansia spiralis]